MNNNFFETLKNNFDVMGDKIINDFLSKKNFTLHYNKKPKQYIEDNVLVIEIDIINSHNINSFYHYINLNHERMVNAINVMVNKKFYIIETKIRFEFSIESNLIKLASSFNITEEDYNNHYNPLGIKPKIKYIKNNEKDFNEFIKNDFEFVFDK